MAFYHFTCSHAAEAIDLSGVLTPAPQIMLGRLPIVWVTPLRSARGSWLGMDLARQHLVTCNRMEVCYQVIPEDDHLIAWWGDLKRDPRFEDLLPAARKLDGARGARPGAWGVSSHPLRVMRAR
jgi:hypothetical protein